MDETVRYEVFLSLNSHYYVGNGRATKHSEQIQEAPPFPFPFEFALFMFHCGEWAGKGGRGSAKERVQKRT